MTPRVGREQASSGAESQPPAAKDRTDPQWARLRVLRDESCRCERLGDYRTARQYRDAYRRLHAYLREREAQRFAAAIREYERAGR